MSGLSPLDPNKVLISPFAPNTAPNRVAQNAENRKARKSETRMPLSYRIATSAPMEAIENFLSDNTVDVFKFYKPHLQYGGAFWANMMPGVEGIRPEEMEWSDIVGAYASVLLVSEVAAVTVYGAVQFVPVLAGGAAPAGDVALAGGAVTAGEGGAAAAGGLSIAGLAKIFGAVSPMAVLLGCMGAGEAGSNVGSEEQAELELTPISGMRNLDVGEAVGGDEVPFTIRFDLSGAPLHESDIARIFFRAGSDNGMGAFEIWERDIENCSPGSVSRCTKRACRITLSHAVVEENMDGDQLFSVAGNSLNFNVLLDGVNIDPVSGEGNLSVVVRHINGERYEFAGAIRPVTEWGTENVSLDISGRPISSENDIAAIYVMDPGGICEFSAAEVVENYQGYSGANVYDWSIMTMNDGASLKPRSELADYTFPSFLTKVRFIPSDSRINGGEPYVINFDNRPFTDFFSNEGPTEITMPKELWAPHSFFEGEVEMRGHFVATGALPTFEYFQYNEVDVDTNRP